MHDLASVLRDQDGIISRTQALLVGLSRQQIDRRLSSGQWQRCAPGVYRSTSHVVTERAALIGAVLWVGPEAVVIGRSAALLWGLPTAPPPRLEIATPRRPRGETTLAVHIRRQLVDRSDIVIRSGVQVLARDFAAVWAAAALEQTKAGAGVAFLDRCLQLGVSHRAMTLAVERHARFPGRRTALRLLTITSDSSESIGERKTATLLRSSGIAGWAQQVTVTIGGQRYRLDFAFVAERVAVEFDGFAFHTDQQRFTADRQRSNALQAAGWVVVHVTWHDLVARPEEIADEIRAIVEVRRAA